MCGIFCSLSRTGHITPGFHVTKRLETRGPDRTGNIEIIYPAVKALDPSREVLDQVVCINLHSTVLGLRGADIVEQPCKDESALYLLCWSGQAWTIHGQRLPGSDTLAIYKLLTDTISHRAWASSERLIDHVAGLLSQVAGPYAFVFLDYQHGKLFFGRDFLGRRSLLTKITDDGDLIISSVSDSEPGIGWSEVEANGIYFIDLKNIGSRQNQPPGTRQWGNFQVGLLPYESHNSANHASVLPSLSLNKIVPSTFDKLDEHSPAVTKLQALLNGSLDLRVLDIPDPPSLSNSTITETTKCKLAILFSGGLDCTVLARLSHDILPLSEPVDLLNVAFENPRVHKKKKINHEEGSVEVYELCPDRITGRASHADLQRVCPDRDWRFIAIDVPFLEFSTHRDTIISLMRPHNTEMDLSIASALYFAARGKGAIYASTSTKSIHYTTSARVLLSGLGADELFAGYTRHATAFKRNGFTALLDELETDVSRLGKRNLGRDDRVISHWRKEARYPYLDEVLLTWALAAPVNDKCGFGESGAEEQSPNDSSELEPGKKVLRCLAWKLGMRDVAKEKKRAIQFGARTAKMTTGKTKGTQLLTEVPQGDAG